MMLNALFFFFSFPCLVCFFYHTCAPLYIRLHTLLAIDVVTQSFPERRAAPIPPALVHPIHCAMGWDFFQMSVFAA